MAEKEDSSININKYFINQLNHKNNSCSSYEGKIPVKKTLNYCIPVFPGETNSWHPL
jgi:hypothetical protein